MLRTVIDFGTREIFNLSLPLRVYGYGLMLVLGFLAGIYLARWRARRIGENPDNITRCGILALLGGIGGARIAFVVERWDDQFARAHNLLGEILNITSGGLIYYGGLILAVLLVVLYLRFKGLSIRRYLDILAVSTMVGLAFGRAGCLLNGCCHGARCDADWPLATAFPMYSRPLVKLDGSPGPFSASTFAPSPVYAEQLKDRAAHLHRQGLRDGPQVLCSGSVAGHVNPDPRLVNQFGTGVAKIVEGGREVRIPVLLLHPPRYLHGRLETDQLATMYASAEEARRQFEALAGPKGRLTYAKWQEGLAKNGFLRGSEHWDEALSFDLSGDQRISFEEAWAYLRLRRDRLERMFGPAGRSDTPVTSRPGSEPLKAARANAYLQEDLYALARHSWTQPVKPAQVLGIVNALLVAAVLAAFFRLRKHEGQVFALMLILYPITRFVLEMIRSDNRHDLARGLLTHNQYTSLATVGLGVLFWLVVSRLRAVGVPVSSARASPKPRRGSRRPDGRRSRKERN